jgi:hypothetical protein
MKEMGCAVIGAPGVEQVAIVHCLAVKGGKVWVAARMPLNGKDSLYNRQGNQGERSRLADETV